MVASVECPACGRLVQENLLNAHLDLSCASGVAGSSSQPGPSSSSSSSTWSLPKPSSSSSSSKFKPPIPPDSSLKKRKHASQADLSTVKRLKPSQAVAAGTAALEAAKPLAELVRPSTLDEVVGQTHLLAKPSGLLRSLIEHDRLGSFVLWGPPGTGKTTLAAVIAKSTKSSFRQVSATSAGATDVRKIFEEAASVLKLTGKKTILFVDEVQRFSKAQQDLFLPYIEAGLISCIVRLFASQTSELNDMAQDATQLATTENPSFRLQTALLSRCRVFVLEKLAPDECFQILKRAMRIKSDVTAVKTETDEGVCQEDTSPVKAEQKEEENAPSESQAPVSEDSTSLIDDDLLRFLAHAADGDARAALNSLELALTARDSGSEITADLLKDSLKKAHLLYDRAGDAHYDTISALHKSVRGSDANAALYWLARMLEGGEDPLYVARRVVRMASEDIGSADPSALPLAMSAYQACTVIGMPECDCILAQAVVHLAEAPKSVRVYKAYGEAKSLVKGEQNYPVPLHIRNAPTKLMKQLDYGKEYRYEPNYAHPVHQEFLPPELQGRCDFLPDSDASLRGKVFNERLLSEWEDQRQGGRKWAGRADMMRGLQERDGTESIRL